jgi:hypothetical protein
MLNVGLHPRDDLVPYPRIWNDDKSSELIYISLIGSISTHDMRILIQL